MPCHATKTLPWHGMELHGEDGCAIFRPNMGQNLQFDYDIAPSLFGNSWTSRTRSLRSSYRTLSMPCPTSIRIPWHGVGYSRHRSEALHDGRVLLHVETGIMDANLSIPRQHKDVVSGLNSEWPLWPYPLISPTCHHRDFCVFCAGANLWLLLPWNRAGGHSVSKNQQAMPHPMTALEEGGV